MRALVLCLVLVSAAGCTPSVRSGWFSCAGAGGSCPSGWRCLGGRCFPGDTDAGPPECRVDLHCDDADPCTEDVCGEEGRCQHNPQDGDCDDGNFCNGPDQCTSGHCSNVGPSPCPATCDGTSCAGCGHVGEACCPGDACSDGVCDGTSTMCVACGSTAGSLCCPGDDCGAPDLVCNGATCTACGGDTQPCCGGGICGGGFECSTGGTCGPTAGCTGVTCGPTEVCFGGGCVPCGTLMGPCCADHTCSEGMCEPGSGLCLAPPACGGLGDPCCTTTPQCSSDTLVCAAPPVGGVTSCMHCGEPGEPCCRGAAAGFGPCADPTTACGFSETCEACGAGELQVCCAGGLCPGTDATFTCVTGYCRASCGGTGEPCCTPARCGGGLSCGTTMLCH